MRTVAGLGLGLSLGAALATACPAEAKTLPRSTAVAKLIEVKSGKGSCATFMKDLPPSVLPYRASFERPLTITRGFGDVEAGVEVHILATNAAVDATLKCRGDDFLRFELRIGMPPKDKATADFDAFAKASLITIMHWDPGKADTVVHAMSTDAAEYLRASEQRGDLYISGKVEYHQSDNLDLGVIWTPSDRTFVVASQSTE